jgi:hypothetical protein
MENEIVTKEDLQLFRMQLLDDIKRMFSSKENVKEVKEWLKSSEVRKLLNASPGTLQNLRIGGQLHPIKIGGSWYYSLAEINSLFAITK